MKRYLPMIIFAMFIFSDAVPGNRFLDMHMKNVIRQRKVDKNNREAVLREVRGFLDESSEKISDGKINLGIPVEEQSITGISETDQFHLGGIILPKIYGFVNTSSLNMRSEDTQKSGIVGKLQFRERVEIVYQSDRVDTVNSMSAPWLLARRENGDEGWVFGAYLSDSEPEKSDTDSGKTDWGMVMPTSGRMSSRFGSRVDPVTKRRNTFHKGIDIAAPVGTPVYAAEKGVVKDAGYKKSGYGNLIMISHGEDMATYYAHLSKILVAKGKNVSKGELIGRVGSTGKSTGPHLHFEIRKGNQALNPEDYIR